MQKKNIGILAVHTVILLVLCGCGGAPADNSDYEPPSFNPSSPNDSDSGSGGSSGSPSSDLVEGVPAGGYLDCENLDVNKVYLYGTLGTDGEATAIGDPLTPTSFCVSQINKNGTLSADGHYLHVINAYDGARTAANLIGPAVGEFHPDTLFLNPGGDWEYLMSGLDPTENDRLMYGLSTDADTATRIIADPTNENQLIYLYANNMYASNGTFFHVVDNSSPTALAIMDDSSVLVGESSGLVTVVQDGGLVSQVSTTNDSSTNWQSVAKHHSGGIWLIVDDNGFQRLNLDTNMELQVDGPLAPRPDELADSTSPLSLAFDGSGNLWELHYTGNNTGLILRRPLAAEGESEVVYRSSEGPTIDWHTNPSPYVFPFADALLITGP